MSAQAAAPGRYDTMPYRRCGRSGLKLPAVSLGLWHNFGADAPQARDIVRTAFDLGITHFDLANNYGPPPGAAEETFGRLLHTDLAAHRDELVISTKAGFTMNPGPYGDGGSRKALVDSLDRSLQRLGVDRVDIFYHHRPDPETPLEETMAALAHIVDSGRALHVGISRYPAELTRQAAALLRQHGTPCLIHQSRYHLLDRDTEALLPTLRDEGIGAIAYSPLAQGLLTSRYLGGTLPADSRAAADGRFLRPEHVTPQRLALARALDAVAAANGRSLAQLALRWTLRDETVCSAIVGASRPAQVQEAVAALAQPPLSDDELAAIDRLCQAHAA